MKEATGELNMTVITVVACESQCGEGNYTKATRGDVDNYACTCTNTGYGSKKSNKQ